MLVFCCLPVFAQETEIAPILSTEEKTNIDKSQQIFIWETFEFEMKAEEKISLKVISGEKILFSAEIRKGVMKVTGGEFKIDDISVQQVFEHDTGKIFLRLRFKYGVLPKGSKLRYIAGAFFLFK